MNIKNNLTFAILVKDGNWKADLTIRFCEYYSHKLNGEDFIRNIIFPATVDEALEQCKTDYLLIQREGSLPISNTFFAVLEDCADQKSDLFLGHVEMMHDYLIVHDTCLFVNMLIWNELGRPSFNKGALSEGPKFLSSNPTLNKYTPGRFVINADDQENCFVPSICKFEGSDFAIHQLETFDSITCIPSVLSDSDIFYLKSKTAYDEIYNETLFEKKYLPLIRSNVFALEDDDMTDLRDTTCDVVVAPAQGLKPVNLAEYFKAKELIIFDSNPMALEFQKSIFNITKATTYGDIVRDFIDMYPDVLIAGDWEKDNYSIVLPLPDLKVTYKIADAFSFEIEELIESVDRNKTTVFDFSDIYVYPFNYYRRPMYQVQGLFAELYSIMKSRTAPTHIMGFAPGFLNMDNIDVNTSHSQYEIDASIPPNDDIELTQEMLDEASDDTIIDEPAVFTLPEPKPASNEVVFTQTISVEQAVIIPPPSPFDEALEHGYVKTTKLEKLSNSYKNFIVYTKVEAFEEFDAIFDYYVDIGSTDWSFRVGKVGLDKRVTFINGSDPQTFSKHLNKQMKINSKTALKHFTGN